MTKKEYSVLVREYHAAKVAADKADIIAKKLKEAMKADGLNMLEVAGFVVNLTEVCTTRLDSKRLKADKLDLYEAYSVQTITTRLYLK